MEKRKLARKMTLWQPQVEDSTGSIRKRFDRLRKETGICKKFLASRIFELGMKTMEKPEPEQ